VPGLHDTAVAIVDEVHMIKRNRLARVDQMHLIMESAGQRPQVETGGLRYWRRVAA
jgi:hypothetical protein